MTENKKRIKLVKKVKEAKPVKKARLVKKSVKKIHSVKEVKPVKEEVKEVKLAKEVKPTLVKEANEKKILTSNLAGKYYYGTGRRKRAIAQVRLYRGLGKFTVNKKDLTIFFKNPELRDIILEPFKSVGQENKFDTTVKVLGGGFRGQAEAVRLGISRALVLKNQTYKVPLKKSGFLTRDPREIERKKPGLKKARRAPQWAKR